MKNKHHRKEELIKYLSICEDISSYSSEFRFKIDVFDVYDDWLMVQR